MVRKEGGSLGLVLKDSKGRIKSTRLLFRHPKRGKIEEKDKNIHVKYRKGRER
ncbi:MAG: hypothetical protein ACTSXO_06940 [Candidatus Heimdallarchaeota archaeon]